MPFTKEEQLELTSILGVNERWGGIEVANELNSFTSQVRTFDYPLDSSKLSRNNPTVNDKYLHLLKVFFAIREECHKGNLGINSKGKLKELKSIEKFEKVFMLRFANCRPQFYSFKKAAELSGLTVENMKNIRAKENIFSKYAQERKQLEFTELNILLELSHQTPIEQLQTNQQNLLMLSQRVPSQEVNNLLKYTNKFIKDYSNYSQPNEGIRFDITDFFNLIEKTTKSDWEADIYSSTLFTTDLETLQYRDMFYQDKMIELKEHFCFRKLFTYESERLDTNKVEYAELTPEGKLLPDWFIHFKNGTFDELKRKEQLVAFFNNFDDRYDSTIDYSVEPVIKEQIEIHQSWKSKNNKK